MGGPPAHSGEAQGYEQLLEIIFTDCTSSRRSGWLDDDECFCSSVIVVPVVVVLVVEPVAVVPVVMPDELELDEASRPVTVTRWPTCAERSLELPSSFQVDAGAVDIVPFVSDPAVVPVVVVPVVPVVPAVVVVVVEPPVMLVSTRAFERM